MRFDPRLVKPDEPPLDSLGEIELPDDLQELAEQLREDAAHLAAVYPCKAEAAPSIEQVTLGRAAAASPSTRGGRWRTWAICSASTALVVALVAAYSWQAASDDRGVLAQGGAESHAASGGGQETGGSAPLLARSPATVSARDRRWSNRDMGRQPRHTAAAQDVVAPAVTPQNLLLNGVSGPEMEGLIDLWQQQGQKEVRIDI